MPARPVGKRASYRLTSPAPSGSLPGLGLPRILLGWLRWICQPGEQVSFDSFSDHMLRDIGVDPRARGESSNGFWRR